MKRLYGLGTFLRIRNRNETYNICQTLRVVTDVSISVPVLLLKETCEAGIYRRGSKADILLCDIIKEVNGVVNGLNIVIDSIEESCENVCCEAPTCADEKCSPTYGRLDQEFFVEKLLKEAELLEKNIYSLTDNEGNNTSTLSFTETEHLLELSSSPKYESPIKSVSLKAVCSHSSCEDSSEFDNVNFERVIFHDTEDIEDIDYNVDIIDSRIFLSFCTLEDQLKFAQFSYSNLYPKYDLEPKDFGIRRKTEATNKSPLIHTKDRKLSKKNLRRKVASKRRYAPCKNSINTDKMVSEIIDEVLTFALESTQSSSRSCNEYNEDLSEVEVYEVQCKELKASFHIKKFISGSEGYCIFYCDQWLTPNQFEKIAGSRAKKYKESLRVNHRPIVELLMKNDINIPNKKTKIKGDACVPHSGTRMKHSTKTDYCNEGDLKVELHDGYVNCNTPCDSVLTNAVGPKSLDANTKENLYDIDMQMPRASTRTSVSRKLRDINIKKLRSIGNWESKNVREINNKKKLRSIKHASKLVKVKVQCEHPKYFIKNLVCSNKEKISIELKFISDDKCSKIRDNNYLTNLFLDEKGNGFKLKFFSDDDICKTIEDPIFTRY